MKYLIAILILVLSITTLAADKKNGGPYAKYRGNRISKQGMNKLYDKAKKSYRLLETDLFTYVKKTDRLTYKSTRGTVGYAKYKVVKLLPRAQDRSSTHIVRVTGEGEPDYPMCVEDLIFTNYKGKKFLYGRLKHEQKGAFLICGTYTLDSGVKIPLAIFLRPFNKYQLLKKISLDRTFVIR